VCGNGYHSDASREADQDQAFAQFTSVGEKGPGESKLTQSVEVLERSRGHAHHQERRHNPIHCNAEPDLYPKGAMLEEVVQALVAYFTKYRVHHDE
jgi:hypothetical protein